MSGGIFMPKFKPNTFKEIYCPVCGTLNIVERNQMGPTFHVEGMQDIDVLHDLFYCPNEEQDWHMEATDLRYKIQGISSEQVCELYQRDLDEILEAHACHLPESGKFLIVYDEIRQLKQDILAKGKEIYTIEFEMDYGPERHSIYFFDKKFYLVISDYEFEDDLKDYSTFAEAFANPVLNTAIENTAAITTSVFSVEEIKKMVKFLIFDEKTILINGEPHRVKYLPPEVE
jgi:hypothetical protein